MPSNVEGMRVTVAKVGERIRRSLTTLREHDNAVTFNSVISKETIAYFDGRKLLDFARELNVQMVGLILDLDLPFYRDPDNVRRALEILLDTYRYGRQIGIPVGGYWANNLRATRRSAGDQPPQRLQDLSRDRLQGERAVAVSVGRHSVMVTPSTGVSCRVPNGSNRAALESGVTLARDANHDAKLHVRLASSHP